MRIMTDKTGTCYLDQDIDYDSNNDNNTANDRDIQCNDTQIITYNPTSNTTTAKLIYETEINGIKKLVSNDVVFKFIDQKVNLDINQEKTYKKVIGFSNSIPKQNQTDQDLSILINELAESIVIGKDSTDNILQIKEFMQKNTTWLSPSQIETLNIILEDISNWDAVAAMWWSLYDQSKANLIQLAPDTIRGSIKEVFWKIEALAEPASEGDKVKEYLIELLTIFWDNSVSDEDISKPWNENKIAKSDIEIIIMPEVCNILWFYEITSEQCRPLEEWGWWTLQNSNSKTDTTSTSPLINIAKKIGIGVGILVLIFIVIVGFFAIKAKLQQNQEEET